MQSILPLTASMLPTSSCFCTELLQTGLEDELSSYFFTVLLHRGALGRPSLIFIPFILQQDRGSSPDLVNFSGFFGLLPQA